MKQANSSVFIVTHCCVGQMQGKSGVAIEGLPCVSFMKAEKSNAFGGHIIEIPQLDLEKVYT
jgi:hypothetical protein